MYVCVQAFPWQYLLLKLPSSGESQPLQSIRYSRRGLFCCTPHLRSSCVLAQADDLILPYCTYLLQDTNHMELHASELGKKVASYSACLRRAPAERFQFTSKINWERR